MIKQWKQFVKYRKLYRFWLNFCENRVKSEKSCAIARVFDKWKYSFREKEDFLAIRPYKQVQEIFIITKKIIDETKDDIQYQTSTIQELQNQNQVLIDNTISGQKLGLSICSDNFKAKKESVFHHWASQIKKQNIKEKEDKLKANMEIIVNLRLKIKELDLDNQDLVIENEQLRKTSMDGIFLAQTWKELSEKIKRLSVDVNDRQKVISNLLDEKHGLAQNMSMMKLRADQVMHHHKY